MNETQPEAPSAGAPDLLLERVEAGFAGLSLAANHQRRALENLGAWLQANDDTHSQLEWLVAERRWPLLLDSFYRVLPFGTGGRRGPVGIGTNRFNPRTLTGSVQGHVDYLRDTYPDTELSVVIVYDVRAYHDLRGLYNADLPNPLIGLRSRDFADMAAEVYTGNGVRVYLPPAGATRYVATPELSYAIRYYDATAGLNVSASHNHPDDNGGKFYNRHGGQEVPPYDEDMARRVESAGPVQRLALDRAEADGLVTRIGPELHDAYVAMNVAQSLQPEARGASIVFTPLHGGGDATVGDVLRSAGFGVELVAEQATCDGRFPAVPFRAPNPEVPESMERGIELARQRGADIVMACDPDADRIGVVARSSAGHYQFVNGNEICILVAHYKLAQLKRLGRLSPDSLVIKTEVTSELVGRIAEEFGVTLIGDLLVGFKYHGSVLERIESPPGPDDPRPNPLQRLGVRSQLSDFVVGVEESHGVMVTAEVRDKDAAGAALLLGELASQERAEGRCVLDYLDDIYRRYGYHANLLYSMVMTGAEGLASIQQIQAALRSRPPQRIAGRAVTEFVDHLDPNGIHGPILSDTDRASRDVLAFRLDDGARLIIRPSGTEPKNKTYIEVPAPALGESATRDALDGQRAETDAAAREIADDFARHMLAIIDVHLPDYALRISGLVPLDRRIDFVERFVPGLEARAKELVAGTTDRAQVARWIDDHLADYGKDARGLVAEAFAAFLDEQRAALDAASADERCAVVDAMEAAFAS